MLKVGATAIPAPTLGPANVPAVAVPDRLELSFVNKPESMTGVPVKTATLPVS